MTQPLAGYPARLGYPAAGWVIAATYLEYVSLGLRRAALHLDLFEQPGEMGVSIASQMNSGFYAAEKTGQSEHVAG